MIDIEQLAQHMLKSDIHDTYRAFLKKDLTPCIFNCFIRIRNQHGVWSYVWNWEHIDD